METRKALSVSQIINRRSIKAGKLPGMAIFNPYLQCNTSITINESLPFFLESVLNLNRVTGVLYYLTSNLNLILLFSCASVYYYKGVSYHRYKTIKQFFFYSFINR